MRLIRAVAEKFWMTFGSNMMSKNPCYKKYDIGDWTYGAPKVLFAGGAKLRVGKYTSIARGVTILLGGNHHHDWVSMYPFDAFFGQCPPDRVTRTSKGNVSIGSDVWIGINAVILSGVTIGDGAIVGAGAVVAKDIAPYSIVVGNPARHVKYRFDQETISSLLEIRWWEWPDSAVRATLTLLMSDQVSNFTASNMKAGQF